MPHAEPLLLELFVIFVWAKVSGEIFEQFGLPAVVGEILAGVALGPYALKFVNPSLTTLSIAELGAIFLLFTVGLETSPKELIRVGRTSLGVGLAGVLAPLVLGFVYLRWLRGDSTHEAIFVAAAMVATSVGITARVMGDLRVLHTRVASIILGAAVADDILGMIVLAVVAGLESNGGVQWLQLIVLLAEAVAFTVFMVFFASKVIHKMRPGVERLSIQNAPLILALALCLGLSVAAERIGMAAIIGAFFAGLAFAEYSSEWSLAPRVNAINEFLAPFFFFTMGARLDLRIFNRQVMVACVVVTLLALIAKVIACGLPVLREGWLSALKVGVGMTPRGEVALIVALVGLQMNMVSPAAYAMVIFMTGATTLLAPPVLRYLFRRDAGAGSAS
ncbi:MAG TPA: cation:proton antiporter [Terriglobales bacterium]|jgi:Kef-type K+ transport system membrane component KefB|nr:cation:proton antiporter [Terriglobales bacterium]